MLSGQFSLCFPLRRVESHASTARHRHLNRCRTMVHLLHEVMDGVVDEVMDEVIDCLNPSRPVCANQIRCLRCCPPDRCDGTRPLTVVALPLECAERCVCHRGYFLPFVMGFRVTVGELLGCSLVLPLAFQVRVMRPYLRSLIEIRCCPRFEYVRIQLAPALSRLGGRV